MPNTARRTTPPRPDRADGTGSCPQPRCPCGFVSPRTTSNNSATCSADSSPGFTRPGALGRSVMIDILRSPKLKPWHLDRWAIVYIRQSTLQQVSDHQESAARQYALVDMAVALGWPASGS